MLGPAPLIGRRRALALLAGVAVLAACGSDAPPAPPTSQVVAWGSGPEQEGDLWRPGVKGRLPVVVLLHGGFWQAGYDRHLEDPVAPGLAAGLGAAVWVPEYRRFGQEGFSVAGMLADVAAAVDHVARLDRVNPNRVVLVGHSAGGQLAAWAALTAAKRGAAVRPRGVVAQAGVLDLGAAVGARMGGGDVAATFADPIERATVDPIRLLPSAVRIACIHGDADTNVTIDQSRSFAAAAQKAGGAAVTLDVIVGEDHFAALKAGTGIDGATHRRAAELLR